ncbi:MAG: PilZ domain-containing protein [Thermoanaerobaculia bacterium]
MTQSERRRSPRVTVVDTRGTLVVSLDCKVLDISLGGMAVETRSRLSPHHSISLRLRTDEATVPLEGRVVWCFLQGMRRLDGGEQVPIYRAGIEFHQLLTPVADSLVRFLEAHAIVTLETRLFGRFTIVGENTVTVSASVDFEVRNLNFHGMAVEAETPLDPRVRCDAEVQLGDERITARCRVVFCRPIEGRSPEAFEIAIEFEEVPPHDRELLDGLLRRELGSATV